MNFREMVGKKFVPHPIPYQGSKRNIAQTILTYFPKNVETLAAYRFGDLSKVRNQRFQGRTVIPATFKQNLIRLYGCKCQICFTQYEASYLQIDHRIRASLLYLFLSPFS